MSAADTTLKEILDNRLIYNHGLVVDQVEPAIAKTLTPAITDLLARAEAKLSSTNITEFSSRRYTSIKTWLQAETEAIYSAAGQEMKDSLTSFAKQEVKDISAIYTFDGQADETGFSSTGITKAQAVAMVEAPVGGATLTDWVSSLGASTADRIQRTVISGIMEGQTYREMVSSLQSIGVGSKREAITLARTYTQSIANAAHDKVMDDNQELLEGKQWLAVFDNRTCPRCAALDGKVYYYDPTGKQQSLSEMPPRPLHPRCRCMAVPVVKSLAKILGVTDSSLPDFISGSSIDYRPFTIRETTKGGVPQVGTGGGRILEGGRFKGTFDDWMKAYPKAAKQILGPARYELWSSGKVRLDDLIGTGTGAKLKTLKQL